jgi:hypothetical protein
MYKSLTTHKLLNWLFSAFLIGLLIHFGLGGVASAVAILSAAGAFAWLVLGLVLFLLLYRLDYRRDLPLFVAGLALGYWGEWWGTTRGVWTYWNGATPPDYLPPLWGLGLITACRLGEMIAPILARPLPRWATAGMAASFLVLPPAALLASWPRLAAVNWVGRLDVHFVAGLLVGAVLVFYRFDLRRAFPLYLCGMLLGGLYEALGTLSGEWTYLTHETPPVWIIPLWGLAVVAMSNLARLLAWAVGRLWAFVRQGWLAVRRRSAQIG